MKLDRGGFLGKKQTACNGARLLCQSTVHWLNVASLVVEPTDASHASSHELPNVRYGHSPMHLYNGL